MIAFLLKKLRFYVWFQCIFNVESMLDLMIDFNVIYIDASTSDSTLNQCQFAIWESSYLGCWMCVVTFLVSHISLDYINSPHQPPHNQRRGCVPVCQPHLSVSLTSAVIAAPAGWVTSSIRRPLSSAAATMPVCVPSAACGCHSWTRRPEWPRTTATSGWNATTAALVGTRTHKALVWPIGYLW